MGEMEVSNSDVGPFFEKTSCVFPIFIQQSFCLLANIEWNFSSLTERYFFFFLFENLPSIIVISHWLECLRNERTVMGSKVYRRQACMSPVHREVPKTNGHSLSLPTSITPELHTTPRLGRPLNLKSYGAPRYSLHCVQDESRFHFIFPSWSRHSPFLSSACSLARPTAVAPACTRKPSPSKWCKAQRTAPRPAARTASGNAAPHGRSVVRTPQQWLRSSTFVCFCWLCFVFFSFAFAQSVREEEKDVYRLLLTMVSGGQSSFVHNGSSHAIVRSHRDL